MKRKREKEANSTDSPPKTRRATDSTFLVDQTPTMDRERRINVQKELSKLAKVHAREHHPDEQKPGLEEALDNGILQHPFLNSQRNDGIDPNLNPEPPLNTEARREFDNAQREKDLQLKHRLGLMPDKQKKFDPQFKP